MPNNNQIQNHKASTSLPNPACEVNEDTTPTGFYAFVWAGGPGSSPFPQGCFAAELVDATTGSIIYSNLNETPPCEELTNDALMLLGILRLLHEAHGAVKGEPKAMPKRRDIIIFLGNHHSLFSALSRGIAGAEAYITGRATRSRLQTLIG